MKRRYLFLTLLAIFAFALFLQSQVVIVKVTGDSMEPTLQDGESYLLHLQNEPERGSIVSFSTPASWRTLASESSPGDRYIKRIVGVPGDELAVSNATFSINGRQVSPLPAGVACGRTYYAGVIPEGHYFVVGDNGSTSLDSRRAFCAGFSDFLVRESSVLFRGELIGRVP